MKLYNMRNNEVIGEMNSHQLNFLKANLLKNGESDEDFFITYKAIKLLEDNAVSEEELQLINILKMYLEKEIGKSGMDIYYE